MKKRVIVEFIVDEKETDFLAPMIEIGCQNLSIDCTQTHRGWADYKWNPERVLPSSDGHLTFVLNKFKIEPKAE